MATLTAPEPRPAFYPGPRSGARARARAKVGEKVRTNGQREIEERRAQEARGMSEESAERERESTTRERKSKSVTLVCSEFLNETE